MNTNEQIKHLNKLGFNIYDCVQSIDKSYIASCFGSGYGKVGIIIGCDEKYIRVYYGENNPYIGHEKDEIAHYNGDIPKDLYDKLLSIIRGKDNEIDILKERLKYLKQFEPTVNSIRNCVG